MTMQSRQLRRSQRQLPVIDGADYNAPPRLRNTLESRKSRSHYQGHQPVSGADSDDQTAERSRPLSMLEAQRNHSLERIVWSACENGRPQRRNHVLACTFTQQDKASLAKQQNWGATWLGTGPETTDTQLEHALEKWLQDEEPAVQDLRLDGVSHVNGGLRLIVCERPNMMRGMSMSKNAFELVETSFDLHPATLPAFNQHGGTHAVFTSKRDASGDTEGLWLVVKANQKVEIGNWLLSASYDKKTGRTNALICGEGILDEEGSNYGSQLNQLLRTLLASEALWSHPLTSATALLQVYTQRIRLRNDDTEWEITNIEETLGVTFAGPAVPNDPDLGLRRWPYHINVKEMTIDIHSLIPQIVYMLRVCKWATGFGRFLQELNGRLETGDIRPSRSKPLVMFDMTAECNELVETLSYILSALDGLQAFYEMVRERADAQADLLFSIISQQESVLSNNIAASTKNDSISVFVFTFITAFFLPSTFVATVFSMSMFDWKADPDSGSAYISGKFWIYWVISIPLTIITLGCWYAWSRRAIREWEGFSNAQPSKM